MWRWKKSHNIPLIISAKWYPSNDTIIGLASMFSYLHLFNMFKASFYKIMTLWFRNISVWYCSLIAHLPEITVRSYMYLFAWYSDALIGRTNVNDLLLHSYAVINTMHFILKYHKYTNIELWCKVALYSEGILNYWKLYYFYGLKFHMISTEIPCNR